MAASAGWIVVCCCVILSAFLGSTTFQVQGAPISETELENILSEHLRDTIQNQPIAHDIKKRHVSTHVNSLETDHGNKFKTHRESLTRRRRASYGGYGNSRFREWENKQYPAQNTGYGARNNYEELRGNNAYRGYGGQNSRYDEFRDRGRESEWERGQQNQPSNKKESATATNTGTNTLYQPERVGVPKHVTGFWDDSPNEKEPTLKEKAILQALAKTERQQYGKFKPRVQDHVSTQFDKVDKGNIEGSDTPNSYKPDGSDTPNSYKPEGSDTPNSYKSEERDSPDSYKPDEEQPRYQPQYDQYGQQKYGENNQQNRYRQDNNGQESYKPYMGNVLGQKEQGPRKGYPMDGMLLNMFEHKAPGLVPAPHSDQVQEPSAEVDDISVTVTDSSVKESLLKLGVSVNIDRGNNTQIKTETEKPLDVPMPPKSKAWLKQHQEAVYEEHQRPVEEHQRIKSTTTGNTTTTQAPVPMPPKSKVWLEAQRARLQQLQEQQQQQESDEVDKLEGESSRFGMERTSNWTGNNESDSLKQEIMQQIAERHKQVYGPEINGHDTQGGPQGQEINGQDTSGGQQGKHITSQDTEGGQQGQEITSQDRQKGLGIMIKPSIKKHIPTKEELAQIKQDDREEQVINVQDTQGGQQGKKITSQDGQTGLGIVIKPSMKSYIPTTEDLAQIKQDDREGQVINLQDTQGGREGQETNEQDTQGARGGQDTNGQARQPNLGIVIRPSVKSHVPTKEDLYQIRQEDLEKQRKQMLQELEEQKDEDHSEAAPYSEEVTSDDEQSPIDKTTAKSPTPTQTIFRPNFEQTKQNKTQEKINKETSEALDDMAKLWNQMNNGRKRRRKRDLSSSGYTGQHVLGKDDIAKILQQQRAIGHNANTRPQGMTLRQKDMRSLQEQQKAIARNTNERMARQSMQQKAIAGNAQPQGKAIGRKDISSLQEQQKAIARNTNARIARQSDMEVNGHDIPMPAKRGNSYYKPKQSYLAMPVQEVKTDRVGVPKKVAGFWEDTPTGESESKGAQVGRSSSSIVNNKPKNTLDKMNLQLKKSPADIGSLRSNYQKLVNAKFHKSRGINQRAHKETPFSDNTIRSNTSPFREDKSMAPGRVLPKAPPIEYNKPPPVPASDKYKSIISPRKITSFQGSSENVAAPLERAKVVVHNSVPHPAVKTHQYLSDQALGSEEKPQLNLPTRPLPSNVYNRKHLNIHLKKNRLVKGEVEVDSKNTTPASNDTDVNYEIFNPAFYSNIMHRYRSKDAIWAALCLATILLVLFAAVWYSKMWRKKDGDWDLKGKFRHEPFGIPIKELLRQKIGKIPRLKVKLKKKRKAGAGHRYLQLTRKQSTGGSSSDEEVTYKRL